MYIVNTWKENFISHVCIVSNNDDYDFRMECEVDILTEHTIVTQEA